MVSSSDTFNIQQYVLYLIIFNARTHSYDLGHMRVVILHLDLGIGGAEQLVVNVATILKRDLQCHVTLLTSHHDVRHCFEATRYENGKLS